MLDGRTSARYPFVVQNVGFHLTARTVSPEPSIRLISYRKAVAGSLVLAVFAVVLLQVTMRYLFERPNPWSEELSRFCFIWLSMIGASLALESQSHFVFDLAVTTLPRRPRIWAHRCSTGIVAAAAFGFITLGFGLVHLAHGQRSAALGLPLAWVYASVPVAGILMLLHLAAGLGGTLPEPEGKSH